ncbi:hypothetical protein Tco_1062125, partial [Tanacetum coccineum]
QSDTEYLHASCNFERNIIIRAGVSSSCGKRTAYPNPDSGVFQVHRQVHVRDVRPRISANFANTGDGSSVRVIQSLQNPSTGAVFKDPSFTLKISTVVKEHMKTFKQPHRHVIWASQGMYAERSLVVEFIGYGLKWVKRARSDRLDISYATEWDQAYQIVCLEVADFRKCYVEEMVNASIDKSVEVVIQGIILQISQDAS